MGERRKRKSAWDEEDDTKQLPAMSDHSSWAGNDRRSIHGDRHCHEVSEPRTHDKPRDDSGYPTWDPIEEHPTNGSSSFKNTRGGNEFEGGKAYYKNISPRHDGMELHNYNDTRGHGYDQTRSQSRYRSRSRSLSRGRERERRRGWIRSRSRNRYDARAKDHNRSRSPINERLSYGWSGRTDRNQVLRHSYSRASGVESRNGFSDKGKNGRPLCMFFAAGKCCRENCRFSHDDGNNDRRGEATNRHAHDNVYEQTDRRLGNENKDWGMKKCILLGENMGSEFQDHDGISNVGGQNALQENIHPPSQTQQQMTLLGSDVVDEVMEATVARPSPFSGSIFPGHSLTSSNADGGQNILLPNTEMVNPLNVPTHTQNDQKASQSPPRFFEANPQLLADLLAKKLSDQATNSVNKEHAEMPSLSEHKQSSLSELCVEATKHPETQNGHEKVEEGSGVNRDEKGTRLFKNSLVEFVKDVLKPTWKEGRMSRDVHKTVVRKVVDKVSSSVNADHIPKTQEKVDQYLACSKPKIAKLVQAYVERSLKKDS